MTEQLDPLKTSQSNEEGPQSAFSFSSKEDIPQGKPAIRKIHFGLQGSNHDRVGKSTCGYKSSIFFCHNTENMDFHSLAKSSIVRGARKGHAMFDWSSSKFKRENVLSEWFTIIRCCRLQDPLLPSTPCAVSGLRQSASFAALTS